VIVFEGFVDSGNKSALQKADRLMRKSPQEL
jgi:hypothetical protein